MELPRNLFCLTLAHSIDDKDVVEQLLADFPEETEQCIPTALRAVLEVDYLPAVPFFSKQELINYLSSLWVDTTYTGKLGDAAYDGLVYLVAYCLDRRADIHDEDDFPLRIAAHNGHADIVKLLLDRNANLHALNDIPLRWATISGHTDIVKLLLDRKADIHARNDDALKIATDYGHTEIVKLLLRYGANQH